MEIEKGFQIEYPNAFVPWGIKESEFLAVLAPLLPRRVVDGYYTIFCKSLGGLDHELGFHFEPKIGGRLAELEFFNCRSQSIGDSFSRFQRHLENTFGPPNSVATKDGREWFQWVFGETVITHYMQDRFGPEEYLRLRRGNH